MQKFRSFLSLVVELQQLPVVIFLITNDLKYKGEIAGADAQISKPEIVELIEIIDQHIK